ncbi:helix-turn-helix transcriptional regulator [Dysgonomonas sp. HDW5B]|uniref:winged helix-turn-helix transcriptional regulator n=1 Tax=Dysgonomonas sp. HDW5B TaxID=2714927 RepID=UPI00140895D8|nr:helix-turn-helix domain-containing protein [Dysgonomonas sp. HDW5B]QIK54813.1 helix-turn-helix transcriptional regulator [Dysgonomonas sp. HDW5B]
MNEEKIKKFEDHSHCPVRLVMSRFGDKWSILVLTLLGDEEVLRFNEMRKFLKDISQKMLTVTLRSLEADGLVKRTIYPEIPPRVEYQLTDLGRSLLPFVTQMLAWASDNMELIMENRKIYEKAT